MFAVTLTGVFISDNYGTNWAADNSGLENVNCFVVVNDQLFAGTDDNGVHRSADGGVTWASFSSGISANTRIWSLAVNSDGIFAGTSSGVWVTTSPTEIKIEKGNSEPFSFSLKQNFPNPFNPSTTISFTLAKRSFVILKVYDILGREVETLINGEMQAGNHNQLWNAANLSSGIYFYRLQAGLFTETKKLVLLK
jgi:hypothetical protein